MSVSDFIFYILLPVAILIITIRNLNKKATQNRTTTPSYQTDDGLEQEKKHESKLVKKKEKNPYSEDHNSAFDSHTEPEQTPMEIDLRKAIIYSEIIKPKYF